MAYHELLGDNFIWRLNGPRACSKREGVIHQKPSIAFVFHPEWSVEYECGKFYDYTKLNWLG